MDFSERYGPWAVIAGASEGTGRSFARLVAGQGVNCLLVAKDGPLEEAAGELRREFGVEAITAAVDLAHDDAAARIIAATGNREVGLYIGNAGADWQGERFLEHDIDDWIALSRINVDTMLRLVHHFGQAMKVRRRGGILLVNSGACYGGSKYLAIYCAAKAFQLNFAESLWSELRVYGLDVLSIVLGRTDTPGYRRRREGRGLTVGTRQAEGLASPDEVAAQGLARLPHGPIHNFGLADDDAMFGSSAAERREKAVMMETIVMHNSGYKPESDL